ncbi:MAG: DNA-binding protein [Candidatus Marinimicrobia bacterium]|nr:DNA-binding protein [Candidatus Neomarinimicrobiota bacterium]
MSITISVRLPEDIANNLADVASETERSKSFHIQKAIEIYLEEFADVQIALDRLRDKDDPLISSEELRAEVGI